MADFNLPLTAHLRELRKRLVICVTAVGVGFLLSYSVTERVFAFLSRPVIEAMGKGNRLIYTGLPDAFTAYFKISLIMGIIVAFPVIIFQIWRFVSPALEDRERKYTLIFMTSSVVLFWGGAFFGYFVILPLALDFLLGFAGGSLRPLVTMKNYLFFATKALLAFGLAFEIPFFLVFLAKIGVLPYEKLRARRKYYILIIFIIAAITTPPDIISQIMVAIPLVILYEIGVLGARLFAKPKI
ncbi:MAG: twin-arginine translocase subunit TatC [Pseudomonadota bacterium]